MSPETQLTASEFPNSSPLDRLSSPFQLLQFPSLAGTVTTSRTTAKPGQTPTHSKHKHRSFIRQVPCAFRPCDGCVSLFGHAASTPRHGLPKQKTRCLTHVRVGPRRPELLRFRVRPSLPAGLVRANVRHQWRLRYRTTFRSSALNSPQGGGSVSLRQHPRIRHQNPASRAEKVFGELLQVPFRLLCFLPGFA